MYNPFQPLEKIKAEVYSSDCSSRPNARDR
jgi:hypothetical protein